MVATQMFLGTAASLIASSAAFVTPMTVRSVGPASSSSLKMKSAGTAYVETLPGAPFGDGKVGDAIYNTCLRMNAWSARMPDVMRRSRELSTRPREPSTITSSRLPV